jgi:hypothetical protein
MDDPALLLWLLKMLLLLVMAGAGVAVVWEIVAMARGKSYRREHQAKGE